MAQSLTIPISGRPIRRGFVQRGPKPTGSSGTLSLRVDQQRTIEVLGASGVTEFTLTRGGNSEVISFDVGDGSAVATVVGLPSAVLDGGLYTAKVAPVIGSAKKGPIDPIIEFFRLSDRGVLSRGPLTFAPGEFDSLFGLGLRQIIRTHALPFPLAFEAALVDLPAYQEEFFGYDGDTIVVTTENVARTVLEAQSFVLFVSYETTGPTASLARLIDVNDGDIKVTRTTSEEATISVRDNAGGEAKITSPIPAGAGRVNLIANAVFVPGVGTTLTTAHRLDAGEWQIGVDAQDASGATELALRAILGIGGRSTGSGSQRAEASVSRVALWTSTGPLDLLDSRVRSLFVNPEGGLAPPSMSETVLGRARLDHRGTSTNGLVGGHDGNMPMLQVAMGALTGPATPVPSLPDDDALITIGDDTYILDPHGMFVVVKA